MKYAFSYDSGRSSFLGKFKLLQAQRPRQLGMQSLRRDDFPLLSSFKAVNGRGINEVAGMGPCFRNFFPLLSFKDFKNIFSFR